MATKKAQLVVWDSCVVIDYLKKHGERFPLIQPMIEQAESGNLKIVVSEITLAEVLTLEKIGSLSAGEITEHVSIVADFFERSYVIGRVVDRPISLLAAQLRRRYHPLGTCDAIILATAVFDRVPTLYTFDGDAAAGAAPKKGKLITLDNLVPLTPESHLRIMKPHGRDDGQTSIDDIVSNDE